MSLDEKTRELVALSASLAGNCLPCLKYHYKKCRELGIAVEDLDETLEMAKTVKETPIKRIYDLAASLLERAEHEDEIDD
jgi:AhpD family alkylhydroperoxidase